MLNLDLFFEFVNVKIGNRIGFSLNKIFEKSNKIEIENILFLYGNKIKDFWM